MTPRAAALTMMEPWRRRCAEALLLQASADPQVGVDCFRQAKTKVWVLAVAERASATFSCVVCRLPRRRKMSRFLRQGEHEVRE